MHMYTYVYVFYNYAHSAIIKFNIIMTNKLGVITQLNSTFIFPLKFEYFACSLFENEYMIMSI